MKDHSTPGAFKAQDEGLTPLQPRPRMTHELKTWPEFFNATRNGRKKFELRENDRDFKVGDELLLKEWLPTPVVGVLGPYTGRSLLVRVDYLMTAEQVHDIMPGSHIYDPPDYVIMSVSLVS